MSQLLHLQSNTSVYIDWWMQTSSNCLFIQKQ